MNDITLSICCITYNQKKYIKDTLNSFIDQQCNFNYEIIIHDDCSNDGTIEILKEYQKKYPNIIKLLLEEENQFSKGKKILPFTFDVAQGKYIAICEGDDYWIDKEKLQKQVDYMEQHPECALTFHNAKVLNQVNNKNKVFLPSSYFKIKNKSGIYNAGEMELIGFIPTASIVTRTEYLKNMPNYYYESRVGDLPIKLYCSSKGYVYYFDSIMSVYRINTGISVIDNWKNYNSKQFIELNENLIDTIVSFDKSTNYKYHDFLQVSLDYRRLNLLYVQKKFNSIKKKQYSYLIKKLTLQGQIKYFIIIYFPYLAYILRLFIHKIGGIIHGK